MRRYTWERAPKPSFSLCFSSVCFIVLLWILFVGGTRRNEMLVGAGIGVISGMFAYKVWLVETLRVEFHLADIIQGWRIPWYILSGIYVTVVVLLKNLFRVGSADSFYRVSGFKTSKSDPRQIARRVLVTFYMTMSPNSIVIGIDYRQSRMLFHQLQRSSMSRMSKALGAQPGANRP